MVAALLLRRNNMKLLFIWTDESWPRARSLRARPQALLFTQHRPALLPSLADLQLRLRGCDQRKQLSDPNGAPQILGGARKATQMWSWLRWGSWASLTCVKATEQPLRRPSHSGKTCSEPVLSLYMMTPLENPWCLWGGRQSAGWSLLTKSSLFTQ